jgi:plastocyanin
MAKVNVEDNKFNPKDCNIKVGETVEWENVGGSQHTVTSDQFDKTLDPGDTFSHTFHTAGTVEYECTIHSGLGMKGKIIVT